MAAGKASRVPVWARQARRPLQAFHAQPGTEGDGKWPPQETLGSGTERAPEEQGGGQTDKRLVQGVATEVPKTVNDADRREQTVAGGGQ